MEYFSKQVKNGTEIESFWLCIGIIISSLVSMVVRNSPDMNHVGL